MSGYVLAVEAERDLEAIWEYVAEDSIEAADCLTTRLLDAFEVLAAMPGMGHARGDLTSERFYSGRLALSRSSIALSRTGSKS